MLLSTRVLLWVRSGVALARPTTTRRGTASSCAAGVRRACEVVERRMPLVGEAHRLFGDVRLDQSTRIFAAQHVLETTELMMDSFVARGIPASNISVIGKCYSADPVVYERMRRKVDLCASTMSFDSHMPYDEQYGVHISAFADRLFGHLRRLLANGAATHPSNVVVMDDGGYLLAEVSRCLHADPALRASLATAGVRMMGVEQTSSGWRRLRHTALPLPVVNVARSSGKLSLESPLIGMFTLEPIRRHIERIAQVLRAEGLPWTADNALVIGGGAIGQQVSRALVTQLDIPTTIFSTEDDGSAVVHRITRAPCRAGNPPSSLGGEGTQTHTSTIAADAQQAAFRSLLPQYRLVIGCTGQTVLGAEELALLEPHTLLISVSSSDREFSAVEIRRATSHRHEWNSLFRGSLNGRELLLPFAGFPITFDDHCAFAGSPEAMQLTMSLLTTAVLQNLQTSQRHDRAQHGFIEVHAQAQERLSRMFHEVQIGKQAEEWLRTVNPPMYY